MSTWNQTQTTEGAQTFNLDAAVAEYREREQQEERKRNEQRAREREEHDAQGRAEIDALLRDALPAAVRTALEIGAAEGHTHGGFFAPFALDGERWRLVRDTRDTWSVVAPEGDAYERRVPGPSLVSALVRTAATRRAVVERRIEEEREEAQEKREREEEHAHIEREISAAKANAATGLWRWPEDVALTLYRWRWQRGRDEDGAGEYEAAWSAEDSLDERGYVPLADGRVIRLIPTVHLPVIEHLTFLSSEQLPSELRREMRITIPGVTQTWTYSQAGDHHHVMRYIRSDALSSTSVTVGHEPVPWVRALLTDSDDGAPAGSAAPTMAAITDPDLVTDDIPF